MWWLTADPSVANFETGYQTLTILVFLLAFPMNVLLKTFASIATIVTCNENRGSLVRETPWWNIPAGLWRSIPPVRDLWPGIKGIWQRVFAVEMLVSAAVIPLQFASLAVITLPLTLPIILSLYIATPSAVLEGTKGWEAIQRSRQLIKPLRWDLGIPFVGLVAGQRVLEALKERIMATLTARIYRELIEIPVVIVVGWWVVSIFLARMQDVLPYVSFNAAKRIESSAPS